MRLTVCLEGNTEGRVLASVDMEEIVKMTITDDIDKSNFNPQMFKSCTDSAYGCGYQQGYQDGGSDMEQAKQIIIDELLKQIKQIRADVIDECADLFSNILSDMTNVCGRNCPIKCNWGTEENCKDMCKKWFLEQLKEQQK